MALYVGLISGQRINLAIHQNRAQIIEQIFAYGKVAITSWQCFSMACSIASPPPLQLFPRDTWACAWCCQEDC